MATRNNYDGLLDEFSLEIDGLMDDLEDGQDPAEWYDDLLGLIALYLASGYMLGKDSPDLTGKDQSEIEKLLAFQAGYLAKFLADIRNGQGSMAAWRARAAQYARSVVPAFWRGATIGLRLPAYPGEGSECRQNCKCAWDIVEIPGVGYDCYWELGYAEHCPTCINRNSIWYPYEIRL